jgi:hypothetical protein
MRGIMTTTVDSGGPKWRGETGRGSVLPHTGHAGTPADGGAAWAAVDVATFCVLGLAVAYIIQAQFRGRSRYDIHLQSLVVDGWYFALYNQHGASGLESETVPVAVAGEPTVTALSGSPPVPEPGTPGGRQKLRKKKKSVGRVSPATSLLSAPGITLASSPGRTRRTSKGKTSGRAIGQE